MTDLTPDTLVRAVQEKAMWPNLVGTAMGVVKAHADAWEADRAAHELLREAVNDNSGDCSPNCGDWGHADGCGYVDMAASLVIQQEKIKALQARVEALEQMVQRAGKLVYDMMEHDDMRANDGYDSMEQHNAVVERLRAEKVIVCNWWLKQQPFRMEKFDIKRAHVDAWESRERGLELIASDALWHEGDDVPSEALKDIRDTLHSLGYTRRWAHERAIRQDAFEE